MKKHIYTIVGIIVLVCLVIFVMVSKKDTDTTQNLSLEESLTMAINDEYKARATYGAVISKYGNVKPFSNIIQAEENHIASLEQLFVAYGFDIPNDEWAGTIEVRDSLSELCSLGVEAEIANAELYNNVLIPAVSGHPDIVAVFDQLMNASENNHLPAFQRCQ